MSTTWASGGGPRGGFGGVRQGLNATKMVGLNMNYDNGNTLQWEVVCVGITLMAT